MTCWSVKSRAIEAYPFGGACGVLLLRTWSDMLRDISLGNEHTIETTKVEHNARGQKRYVREKEGMSDE